MAGKWSNVFRILKKIVIFLKDHPEIVEASIEAAKAVKAAKKES